MAWRMSGLQLAAWQRRTSRAQALSWLRSNPSFMFPTNYILGGEVPLPPGTSCLVKRSYTSQTGMAPRRMTEGFWLTPEYSVRLVHTLFCLPPNSRCLGLSSPLRVQISQGDTGQDSIQQLRLFSYSILQPWLLNLHKSY